ncbi:uncharacterized protein B0H64DRAFT_294335, partial [Chaetomium fimeti]
KALNGPLGTAERKILRLVGVSMPLVVVSGSTVYNPAVESFIRDLYNAEGVPVVFTNKFGFPLVY